MPEKLSDKFYEFRHLVTFTDTNIVGNVYYAQYVQWMGKCREEIIAQHYPEISDDIKNGFGFATEYVHMDYMSESFLFDPVLVKMFVADLTRTRIEFIFEFYNEKSGKQLAVGSQAIVWVNSQHRPSLMPDKVYDSAVEFFEIPASANGF